MIANDTETWVPMHSVKEGDVIMLTHERYVVELVEAFQSGNIRLTLIPERGGHFNFDEFIDNPIVSLNASKYNQVLLMQD